MIFFVGVLRDFFWFFEDDFFCWGFGVIFFCVEFGGIFCGGFGGICCGKNVNRPELASKINYSVMTERKRLISYLLYGLFSAVLKKNSWFSRDVTKF